MVIGNFSRRLGRQPQKNRNSTNDIVNTLIMLHCYRYNTLTANLKIWSLKTSASRQIWSSQKVYLRTGPTASQVVEYTAGQRRSHSAKSSAEKSDPTGRIKDIIYNTHQNYLQIVHTVITPDGNLSAVHCGLY